MKSEKLAGIGSGFLSYLFGRVLSLSGAVMAPVAMTFLVMDTNSTIAAIGYVVAARTTGLASSVMFGGVLADRYPPRRVLAMTSAGAALGQGAVASAALSGHPALGVLILLELLNGMLVGLGMPAQQSIVPQLVEQSHIQFANAILSTTRSLLFALGPAAAGIIVTVSTPASVFVTNAIFAGLAAAFFLRMSTSTRVQERTSTSWWHDAKSGWRDFTSRRWVVASVASMSFLNLMFAGAWMTVGPIYVSLEFGRQAWATALTAEAVGFVAMGLVLMRVTLTRPLAAGFVGAACLCGLPMIVFSLTTTPTWGVLAAALAGAGLEVCSAGWQVGLMTKVPPASLGRVSAYDNLLSLLAAPLGALTAAQLSAVFEPRVLLLVLGLLIPVCCLAPVLSHDVRAIRMTLENERITGRESDALAS